MPIAALSDILFYWDAIAGPQPIVGGEPTFSRSSSGLVIPDRAFRVRSLAADYPRFPWVTVGGDRLPALHLELARTNKCLESETFDSGTWPKTRVTVTADAVVAPDGTLTADEVFETVDTGVHVVSQTVTITDGGTHVVSVFARANGRDWLVLRSVDGGIGFEAFFDVRNGVKGTLQTVGSGATATRHEIEDVGNGWYRCTIVGKKQAGDTTTSIQIGLATGDLSSSYAGDTSKSIYVWGAQLEDNVAFGTSYAGATTTSQVARAVESMQWNGAPNPQAMVVYIDVVLVNPTVAAAGRFFTIGNSASGAELQQLFVRESNSGIIRLELRSDANSVIATLGIGSPVVGDRLQVASVVNADGSGRIIGSLNGAVPVGTDLSAPADGLPSAWSANKIWLNSGNTLFVNAGKYRQLTIVKPGNLDAALDGTADQALLDELEALTVNQFGQVRT